MKILSREITMEKNCGFLTIAQTLNNSNNLSKEMSIKFSKGLIASFTNQFSIEFMIAHRASIQIIGSLREIRTHVASLRRKHPGPLEDGAT
jgi:hypothetical protein